MQPGILSLDLYHLLAEREKQNETKQNMGVVGRQSKRERERGTETEKE